MVLMEAALAPPVRPMLATLARELPAGDYLYEPKWDGFRCLAFRSAAGIDLRSRHDRPLARYFPELTRALERLSPAPFVLDGEILLASAGRHDFARLMARIHPAASRVEELSVSHPATFVAFDLLAQDGRRLLEEPLHERRRRLEELLASPPRLVQLTDATADPAQAERWLGLPPGAGIDGVVAKPLAGAYRPGKRALVKVKRLRTAECVVAGIRVAPGRAAVASLLLGLYDSAGRLVHVGVASSFSDRDRLQLAQALRPRFTELEGHPWENGFGLEGRPMGRLKGAAGVWTPELSLDWVPVRPELVCEVGYDQLDENRFRHPATFLRWRPDRTPESCTFAQLSG
jgi:ATP-dependent DNA ligase